MFILSIKKSLIKIRNLSESYDLDFLKVKINIGDLSESYDLDFLKVKIKTIEF